LKLPDASVIPTINVPLGSSPVAGASVASVVSSFAATVVAAAVVVSVLELQADKNADVTIIKQRNNTNDFFILFNPPSQKLSVNDYNPFFYINPLGFIPCQRQNPFRIESIEPYEIIYT
jgi:hypothetical protein